MDTKIAATGEAVGGAIAKYKSEFMLLIAVCVMIGGYIFSAYMYKDMRTFIEAQTQAQIETAKTLAELALRMEEVEMELKTSRPKTAEAEKVAH